MKIHISWRHMEHSPKLVEIINNKVIKLEKCSDRISSVDVVISQEGSAQQHSRRELVELQIKLSKIPLFIIKEQGYDLQALIDNCVDRAKRKIKDLESKVRDTRRKKHSDR